MALPRRREQDQVWRVRAEQRARSGQKAIEVTEIIDSTPSATDIRSHVWNVRIIYPFIAWVLGTAGHAWYVMGHKPTTESEIQREIGRQAGIDDEKDTQS